MAGLAFDGQRGAVGCGERPRQRQAEAEACALGSCGVRSAAGQGTCVIISFGPDRIVGV